MTSRLLLCCIGLAACTPPVAAQLPAFPGAEGAGMHALGGRDGDLYRVTNLNDSGPGSFRYGVDSAPASGRTIVFEVGGTIDLASRIRIDSPNLTVAGQTAPGGGVTLKGYHLEVSNTEDVVVRYLRVRPGDIHTAPNVYEPDSIWVAGSSSVVLDHVSVAWSTDENLSTTHNSDNISVQWSLITEALHNSNHNKGNHGYGSLINGGDFSFHHNLYAHNRSRNPRPGQGGDEPTRLDFVNNVIYNPGGKYGYGGNDTMFLNFVGNYGVSGPNTSETDLFVSGSGATEIYQSGNFMDLNKDGVLNGASGGWSDFDGPLVQRTARFDLTPVTTQSAADALSSVLAGAGASQFRDAVDDRIVADALSYGAQGAHIDSQSQVGGWPTLPAGVAPTDTDLDGMPDAWETKHGLNPGSSADRVGDFDDDGYTNLEEYHNELGAFPATAPLVFEGSTNNRFAQIENWTPRWQPSRFDTVLINAGSAVVDSVGQHAGTLRIGGGSEDAELNIASGWLEVASAVEIAPTGGTGQLNLSGGELRTNSLRKGAGGEFSFTGGVLSAGVVEFDVVNQGGVLSPGGSIGVTQVLGDASLHAGSLEIELASPTDGDVLSVTGVLALGGDLSVSLLNGFNPQSGSWVIATAAGIAGAFDSVTAGYSVSHESGSLVLSVASAIPGDYSGNGVVDAADYTVWRDGDSPDSSVTGYLLWRDNFGASQALTAKGPTTVPAPQALMLVALGIASAWLNRSACGTRRASCQRRGGMRHGIAFPW